MQSIFGSALVIVGILLQVGPARVAHYQLKERKLARLAESVEGDSVKSFKALPRLQVCAIILGLCLLVVGGTLLFVHQPSSASVAIESKPATPNAASPSNTAQLHEVPRINPKPSLKKHTSDSKSTRSHSKSNSPAESKADPEPPLPGWLREPIPTLPLAGATDPESAELQSLAKMCPQGSSVRILVDNYAKNIRRGAEALSYPDGTCIVQKGNVCINIEGKCMTVESSPAQK